MFFLEDNAKKWILPFQNEKKKLFLNNGHHYPWILRTLAGKDDTWDDGKRHEALWPLDPFDHCIQSGNFGQLTNSMLKLNISIPVVVFLSRFFISNILNQNCYCHNIMQIIKAVFLHFVLLIFAWLPRLCYRLPIAAPSGGWRRYCFPPVLLPSFI